MILNEHVNVTANASETIYEFTPDDGYALWDDTQEGNLDENGEPIHFYLSMIMNKENAEATAPHIWARLIDDTMQVYGVTKPTEKV